MTDEQKEKIRNMREQGIGYLKIAKTLGISQSTVSSFCRRNGLDGTLTKNLVRCKMCGKTIRILHKVKPRKFCSDDCRIAWWNSHPSEVNRKAVYTFTCLHCGKVFTAYGNKTRKYCSHECYIKDRYESEENCDG